MQNIFLINTYSFEFMFESPYFDKQALPIYNLLQLTLTNAYDVMHQIRDSKSPSEILDQNDLSSFCSIVSTAIPDNQTVHMRYCSSFKIRITLSPFTESPKQFIHIFLFFYILSNESTFVNLFELLKQYAQKPNTISLSGSLGLHTAQSRRSVPKRNAGAVTSLKPSYTSRNP